MLGQFTMLQSAFPRELAEFVNFLGGDNINKVVLQVAKKRKSHSPTVWSVFQDRFFFHEKWVDFVFDQNSFQLDYGDATAVRTASLIAGVNRIKADLSLKGRSNFRAKLLGILRPDQDVRQLEHEMRAVTHFRQKNFAVKFADLERLGNFDLLINKDAAEFEIECKTISDDTGAQIKSDLMVNLSETFINTLKQHKAITQSGIYILTFKKPTSKCVNLGKQVQSAILTDSKSEDFGLTFCERPQWSISKTSPDDIAQLRASIAADTEIAGADHYFVTLAADRVIGLSLRAHKPSQLRDRAIQVLKDAADQCTGNRPSCLWLHFLGVDESNFLQLASFSMAGKGSGLNNIVSAALLDRKSKTDRSHVHMVRFSATSNRIEKKLAIGPDRLLGQSASLGGPCYDVPNPYCRFRENADF
jgi:hypothetical protein